MIRGLYRAIQAQQFHPTFIGLFVNPFYHARRGLRNAISEIAPRLTGRLLDVGCGRRPYEALFAVSEYIGLELDTVENRTRGHADVFYDGERLPFPNDSFDSVLCNQVLEHVFRPDPFLSEIRRVLKRGGSLLMTVPFVWDEHEQPHDYARYSSFGLKHLLEKNGFQIQHHRKINADVRVLCQLINAYLYKAFWSENPILKVLCCALLMAPFNILGGLLHPILPKNPDLYLDQLVLAQRH
jgi:SAM-dependent methyltransferase